MLIGKKKLDEIFKHSDCVKKQNTLQRKKNLLGVVLGSVLIKIISVSIFCNKYESCNGNKGFLKKIGNLV